MDAPTDQFSTPAQTQEGDLQQQVKVVGVTEWHANTKRQSSKHLLRHSTLLKVGSQKEYVKQAITVIQNLLIQSVL